MNDREQIVDLVHRYSDAVTRNDESAWAPCWAGNSWWDLGKGRVTRGKTDIVDYWNNAMSGLVIVVQMVHNGTCTVGADGVHATGRWYVSEHLERVGGARNILLAWYDDEYIRIDGEWLFKSRKLTRLYAGAPDLSSEFTVPK
jgi:SnoaL-like domain